MAISTIKGRDIGLFVEKTAGSNTYQRVGCVGDVSLDLNTEEDEATCVASGNFKEFEPGQMDWSGSASLTARYATDAAAVTGPPAVAAQTDATDNVTLTDLIDYQIAGRRLLMRVTLGVGTGMARYGGIIFITKSGIKGQVKGVANGSISYRGTGPLIKSAVTA